MEVCGSLVRFWFFGGIYDFICLLVLFILGCQRFCVKIFMKQQFLRRQWSYRWWFGSIQCLFIFVCYGYYWVIYLQIRWIQYFFSVRLLRFRFVGSCFGGASIEFSLFVKCSVFLGCQCILGGQWVEYFCMGFGVYLLVFGGISVLIFQFFY